MCFYTVALQVGGRELKKEKKEYGSSRIKSKIKTKC